MKNIEGLKMDNLEKIIYKNAYRIPEINSNIITTLDKIINTANKSYITLNDKLLSALKVFNVVSFELLNSIGESSLIDESIEKELSINE